MGIFKLSHNYHLQAPSITSPKQRDKQAVTREALKYEECDVECNIRRIDREEKSVPQRETKDIFCQLTGVERSAGHMR